MTKLAQGQGEQLTPPPKKKKNKNKNIYDFLNLLTFWSIRPTDHGSIRNFLNENTQEMFSTQIRLILSVSDTCSV